MPREKNQHGQYFTPAGVAKLMISLISAPPSASILEPCAGEGVFLDELDRAGFLDFTAVEIDPDLCQQSSWPMHCGSFVSWGPPDSFDVVIGNPPYIRWRDLDEASRQEVLAHPLYGELFNSLSDYLTVFIAASVDLLEDGGELIFITPSFWMHTQHSGLLREWLLERGAITDVIDFKETSVFNGVASAIVIFRFKKGEPKSPINYYRYRAGRHLPKEELDLSNKEQFSLRKIAAFKSGAHWSLSSTKELAPAKLLERATKRRPRRRGDDPTVRLGEYVDIANGMVSGLDRAFAINEDLLESLNAAELLATFEVLKAANIENLTSATTSYYINIPPGLSQAQASRRYPHFMRHLEPFRTKLGERFSYVPGLPFWEWSFKRSEGFFLNGDQKGFVPCKERLTSRSEARFSTAPAHVVATQDVTAFAPKENTRESISYIVAYLAQPIVTDWIRHRGLMKGGVAEFSERPLANIPFRAIDFSSKEELASHRTIVRLMQTHASGSTRVKKNAAIKISAEFEKLLGRA
jgi:adenine-specific DNA-methyltransferase